MPKTKYQLEDFLTNVNENNKGFISTVHEMLLRDNYRPQIKDTKNGLQISYFQPKIKVVAGVILVFLFREGKEMIRIYAKNHKAYLHLLTNLPKKIQNQIDLAADCVKFKNPQKCWNGCGGYDFYIGEEHYQKCLVQCFQLDIDEPNIPYLMELIKAENNER